MDGALATVGVPRFLIDIRRVEDDAAARWLERDREWRAQDAQSVLKPAAAFDAVYFVSEISRARPSPLALRRYGSLEE
jgi:hypothetical protein